MTANAPQRSSQGRFDLPGLNLPLNWTPHEEYHGSGGENPYCVSSQGDGKNLFPTALDDAHLKEWRCILPLFSLRELTMLHIMNGLTDKPDWDVKVFDTTIAAKWKAEAVALDGHDITQKMMDWVIGELRYKSCILKATGAINVYAGDVVKSDTAISTDLKLSLRAAVKCLEDIPQAYKDYHPGSGEKVLDLVHPSLFPLMYGYSRVLATSLVALEESINKIGTGSVIKRRPDKEMELEVKPRNMDLAYYGNASKPYSKKYQWLPCEVDISGGKAKITSYINNLHPNDHQDLYEIIEKVLFKTIPLWNMTLSPLDEGCRDKRIHIDHLTFDPDPDLMDEDEKPQQLADEDDDVFSLRLDEWEDHIRTAVQPEPGEFATSNFGNSDYKSQDADWKKHNWTVDLVRDFAHRGLQVIVKLANIELTPQNPKYEGGSWHVEGQLNEHICATALYYYDNENITDSYLSFRQQGAAQDLGGVSYPVNKHKWVTDIFGCDPDGSTVQVVGGVLCKEGRLLTFPNVLQHRVVPFELADATKPGHRKILALFLVDPRIRIISTANVPPQQRDWWKEKINQDFTGKGALGKLSAELKEQIFEGAGSFPFRIDVAKDVRLRLMKERRHVVRHSAESFQRTEFCLCEH